MATNSGNGQGQEGVGRMYSIAHNAVWSLLPPRWKWKKKQTISQGRILQVFTSAFPRGNWAIQMTTLIRFIPSIMSTDPGPQNTISVGFENILFIVCEIAIIYRFSSEEQSRALAETRKRLTLSVGVERDGIWSGQDNGEWMLVRGSISPCLIPFLSVSHSGLCSCFHLNTQEAFFRQVPVRVLYWHV